MPSRRATHYEDEHDVGSSSPFPSPSGGGSAPSSSQKQQSNDLHRMFSALGPSSSSSSSDAAKGDAGSSSSSSSADQPPCRSCTDFRTWMKMSRAKQQAGDKKNKKLTPPLPPPPSLTSDELELAHRDLHLECPADKDDLGRATWKFLHTMSVNLPDRPDPGQQNDLKQFVTLFGRLYPCQPCAEDFREDVKNNPVRVETGEAFAQWLCQAHNRVNEKLGKEQFDCGKVFERWRDGWKDGRCD